jgi:hypothetical protein
VDLGTQCVDGFVGSALEYQASGAGDQSQPNTGETLPVEKQNFELLSKHGSNEFPLTHEIQQYRCLTVRTGDPLTWWNTQAEIYPRLTALARSVYLYIPATIDAITIYTRDRCSMRTQQA